ncbi:MAG: DEAD/DEAH box helicase [Desulfobacterales bacterium]|nr:DEAD/DEAH box helicase [Desulfobacterales bacterium]
MPKIKPGADTRLLKIFASIGVPDEKPFKPDPFQLQALSAINRGDCLVTAPTGAGKTWIAVQAIEHMHTSGKKSWYASPLKALTNAKYKEFSDIFGPENVGILTGDRKENPDAPVIVGTTEILRNQLYDAMHIGKTLATDFVVLDEAHFLGDEDRGVVWEEIMIYLPSRIPLLLLSATIGNARLIAEWLSSLRSKECIVVNEIKRPVPLSPLFLHPEGTLLPLTVQRGQESKTRLYKKVSDFISSKHRRFLAPPGKLPPVGDILGVLRKFNLLPAIFFLKSRSDSDNALNLCEKNNVHDPNKKEILSQRIENLLAHVPHIAKHRQRWHIENLAVGSHHSGQLPAWKLVLETLMTEGLLDAVFATSTVAAGVNFPARTIVFLNSDRFNGKEFMPLSPTEFHQMTGRAGRRGMDNIGFALAIPGKFMDIRSVARLVNSPASDVISQIRINFSMVLNLLLSHTPFQIEDLLKKSFAAYIINKNTPAQKSRNINTVEVNGHEYLVRDFYRHFDFLKECGYVTQEGILTHDGKWAAKLRVDQPLMIAEAFKQGVFPESDPILLAAIMAVFVNENEADDRISKEFIPQNLAGMFFNLKSELRPFARLMIDHGFDVRVFFFRPAVSIFAWASGQPWDKVVALSEMEEGNLAMLILRTADNLRHIRALSSVFPEAAETSSKSISLIMREPVFFE